MAKTFSEAALLGLAPDGGLFIPEELPRYRSEVRLSLASMSFLDIAFETISPFVQSDIPVTTLQDIIEDVFNFPAPVVEAGNYRFLELFHGPTAAFKDFGARFMARSFSYLRRGASKPLTILTATSGDTGGAVASGFSGVEGIAVTVLYPKGRVSPLQEKQIAGIGGNIRALAVEGSFDDCQRMVKDAFSNKRLNAALDISSANSINIARLVPQVVYYSVASVCPIYMKTGGANVFSVPSGNLGNLTAGMYARGMGAPIDRFIAATNINKTVPSYLSSGVYTAASSLQTISNAMDVGAPSNFERMESHWSLVQMRSVLEGRVITDDETREMIKKVYDATGYIMDPHGAVACAAAEKSLLEGAKRAIILETAHPAKFAEIVEPITGPVPKPPQLAQAEERSVNASTIPASGEALEAVLLGQR
jgi:threonine synthase